MDVAKTRPVDEGNWCSWTLDQLSRAKSTSSWLVVTTKKRRPPKNKIFPPNLGRAKSSRKSRHNCVDPIRVEEGDPICCCPVTEGVLTRLEKENQVDSPSTRSFPLSAARPGPPSLASLSTSLPLLDLRMHARASRPDPQVLPIETPAGTHLAFPPAICPSSSPISIHAASPTLPYLPPPSLATVTPTVTCPSSRPIPIQAVAGSSSPLQPPSSIHLPSPTASDLAELLTSRQVPSRPSASPPSSPSTSSAAPHILHLLPCSLSTEGLDSSWAFFATRFFPLRPPLVWVLPGHLLSLPLRLARRSPSHVLRLPLLATGVPRLTTFLPHPLRLVVLPLFPLPPLLCPFLRPLFSFTAPPLHPFLRPSPLSHLLLLQFCSLLLALLPLSRLSNPQKRPPFPPSPPPAISVLPPCPFILFLPFFTFLPLPSA
ncbi:hypothetical protein AMTR_s00045p00171680 [Amborella trichopoda]|uniref:Uncharacterized protein n=1 Tax=Amborella trichopoda TaxID=13333 RepID=W1P583_AMBTC|nr:hypothetical protein AMTR_s00045p00171680 [Amborella trichopoda]